MKIFCDTHGNTNAPCNAMTAGDSRPVRLFVRGVVGLVALLLSLASGTAAAQNWTKLDGEATDIGVGADASVWVVGTNESTHGNDIYRRSGSSWRKIGGYATRLAVGPNGNAWMVQKAGHIYAYESGRWTKKPGRARDIGVGADGSVWVIGTTEANGGYGIYRRDGSTWTRVSGAAERIAVGPDGNAWVVNAQGKVWQWTGSGWTQRRSEGAADIGVGADGSVWITTTDGAIYRRVGAVWVKQSGGAQHIAVGSGGEAWVVNRANKIYRSGSSSSATPSNPAASKANSRAFVFDGASTWIKGKSDISTVLAEAASLTMEAWVYPEGGSGQQGLLTFHTTGGGNLNLLLYRDSRFQYYDSSTRYVASSNRFSPGRWYHVALTIDAAKSARLYVNGQEEASFSTSVRPARGASFSIGQEWDGSTPTDFFRGRIDEVRLWSVARTQGQIRAGMQQQPTSSEASLPVDLEVYYPFTDGSRYTGGISATGIVDATTNNDVSASVMDGTKRHERAHTSTGRLLAAGPSQEDRAVAQRTGLRSKRSDTAVKVRFLNSSAVPLKLHWIDYQGEEKEIGIIHPGKEQVMNTFATHPWRLKDMSAGVVALEHVTTETPATQLAVVYSKVDENGSMRLPDESANGATAGSLTGKDFFDALNPFDDDQTTCWRESYGRGVGTIPPSSCTSGKVNDAGLCYEPCKDGYQGIAHKCWQVDCPSGYRDDGLYCAKPFPAWNYGCPGGMTDIGVSCRKNNYVRGAGTVPVASCPSGKANDAGLCYEPCGEFYNGVGPVCWANTCPAEFPVDCGAACAKSTGDCAESIVDQTTTTVEFVANIASIAAGAGPVMKSGNRFISQTAKMSKSAIKSQLKAKAKQIGKKLGEEALETAASSAYQAQLTGGISFADLDPTGVTAVAAAFYRETCDEYK